ncbi:MAG TPA: PTS sugar transporter subunit IIA, partial [Planctomycetota bacterium]|nr:PTS sugar transporter subunit IIA [Planctomycetota bacterium]
EAVLGILPEGVPFGAPDGQPATIIVLLLIPRSAVRKYSTTLAGIARLLGQEEARRALRGSRSPAEAMDILRVHEGMDVRKEVP